MAGSLHPLTVATVLVAVGGREVLASSSRGLSGGLLLREGACSQTTRAADPCSPLYQLCQLGRGGAVRLSHC